MTKDHKDFLKWLTKEAPIIALILEGYWQKGERYYIDTRVNLKGNRRLFNKLNKIFKERR